jgi:transcription factor-like protein
MARRAPCSTTALRVRTLTTAPKTSRQHPSSRLGKSPASTHGATYAWHPRSALTPPLVNESLALFFTQQCPQFMFVYREAFLSDYFTSEHGGKYWSFPLLYALCALGVVHSSEPQTRKKAFLLAKCAEEILITHELGRPSFTTVQALLCLGFHEVGHGNLSRGWLLSGMAFRMGQDPGFHRESRLWIGKDSSILTASDVEIRRRIYWGCYLADKFISLYLGRPVSLMECDAEVEHVEPLPDFPDGRDWFGLTELALDFSRTAGMRPQLTLGFRHMVVLGSIFQGVLTVIFSPKPRANQSSILNHLGQFNLRLNRWHSVLPESLQWSQWASKSSVEPHSCVTEGNRMVNLPSRTSFADQCSLLYHSMLSLNRHFIDPSKHPGMVPNQQSQSACAESCDAVVAIVRQFRNQPSSRPPFILLYALSTVTITILTSSGRQKHHQDARLSFVMKAMAECAPHFRLAGETRSKLARHLEARSGSAASKEQTKPARQAASNIESAGTSASWDVAAQNSTLLSLDFPAEMLEAPAGTAIGMPLTATPGFEEGFRQFRGPLPL